MPATPEFVQKEVKVPALHTKYKTPGGMYVTKGGKDELNWSVCDVVQVLTVKDELLHMYIGR